MKYEFHPEALAEYRDAAHFYARKQPGLDLRFILAIEHTIESILEDPSRAPFCAEDVRRQLIRVFPYAILYTADGHFVHVLAVAHCSREPDYWKKRSS